MTQKKKLTRKKKLEQKGVLAILRFLLLGAGVTPAAEA
jgi:hypothetical protein